MQTVLKVYFVLDFDGFVLDLGAQRRKPVFFVFLEYKVDLSGDFEALAATKFDELVDADRFSNRKLFFR